MIGDWFSYRAADFVPFTAEVYYRLIERLNAAHWPLHLLTFTAAVALVPLLNRGYGRIAGLVLAALCAWVGYDFLLREYASLSWAARHIAWSFWLQAALFAGAGLSGRFGAGGQRTPTLVFIVGAGLCLVGFSYPLLAIISGAGWTRAEVVGMHPDPTMVLALGLCLLALRGGLLFAALIVPLGWCLISAVTLWVLEAAGAPVLVACGLMACVAALDRALVEGRWRRAAAARDDPSSSPHERPAAG